MKNINNSKLRIIPLGGLEQIGMNITAFEFEDSIVVVDCGLSFPEDDMLGIDLVIPDITYLKNNAHKVKGFVITHGHEDHIGALPYVLKELNVPVYATRLTIALIEHKLKEHNLLKSVKRKVVKHGQSINLGKFRIEFIKTNHSIADASALAIYSPAGIVVHTGDFKVDYTPVFGDAIDLQRFGEIGKKGVLALMCDSTNAERKGFTMSERTVGKTFDNIFAEHKNTRIIIATFASNVDRVQQIINSAYKYGRKCVVEGRSMVNVISTAAELGYLNVPENTLIELDQMKNYPDEQMVLITTGSQGESMAALSRMASNMHRKVQIKPGDTVIFSSNPIPGNEKAVSRVINELSMKGADVIFQDAHVSGHACQEEIKLIYSLVHPKYAIPVHGEYRHLKAQAQVAESLGIPKDNIFLLSSGDVLELDEEKAQVEAGEKANVYLEVTKLEESAVPAEDIVKTNAKAAEIEGIKKGLYLDISMWKVIGDSEPEKVTGAELSKKVKISVELPENLIAPKGKTRTYYVIRVHDGVAEILPTTLNGKTITFETDRFSTYSIWYTEQDVKGTAGAGTTDGKNDGNNKKPADAKKAAKTGDYNHIGLLCLLLAMSVVVTGGTVVYKRRKNR